MEVSIPSGIVFIGDAYARYAMIPNTNSGASGMSKISDRKAKEKLRRKAAGEGSFRRLTPAAVGQTDVTRRLMRLFDALRLIEITLMMRPIWNARYRGERDDVLSGL